MSTSKKVRSTPPEHRIGQGKIETKEAKDVFASPTKEVWKMLPTKSQKAPTSKTPLHPKGTQFLASSAGASASAYASLSDWGEEPNETEW